MLAVTIPKVFADQNGLEEGSLVVLRLEGKTLTVQVPARPRYRLNDLMAEMPDGLPTLDEWDDMPVVGLER